MKWLVEIDATCSNEWAFKHNKRTRFDIDVIQEIYHVKKSHNCKHHRFHVYDDSFDRQIKTLHDEIWFESVIESHIDLDSHILRNRVEFISNFSKNVKIDRLEKDQKSWKKRVDSVTFVINSRDRWIRVWDSKISAIDDEEDRILYDIKLILQILLNQRMWWCSQKHSSIQTSLIIHSEFKRLIEVYKDKRSKTKNHSESQENQFLSRNWKNDSHFYESVTINKMNERQKSFVSKNFQNAHSQVQWSHDRHI